MNEKMKWTTTQIDGQACSILYYVDSCFLILPKENGKPYEVRWTDNVQLHKLLNLPGMLNTFESEAEAIEWCEQQAEFLYSDSSPTDQK